MPKKLSASERAQRLQNPIAKFLERAFLDWQSASGERKSQRDFAEYLGFGHATLGKLIRGEVDAPERDTVEKIAARCGPGIYDALGLPRPDPLLQVVIANWGALSREQRDEISTWLGISTVGLLARPNNRVVADAISGQKAPARAPRSNGRAVKKHK